jgi:hypothetical protein
MGKSWGTTIVCAPIAILVAAGCGSGSAEHGPTASPASATTRSSSTAPGDNSTIDTKNLTAEVFAAVKASDSFRVVGNGKDSGTSYTLDIHFGSTGGSGHFSQGSQRFDLSGAAGVIYIKASAATWKQTVGKRPDLDTVAATLAAHWVKVPSTGSQLGQLGDYVDKDKFVSSFSESSTTSGPFTRSGNATVGGVAAVSFIDQSDQSRIYIAAHGAPRLLKVEAPAGQGGGGLTFSEYDEPFTPTMPAPGDVIDLTSVIK